MEPYVVLLRGVNVGGKSKVPMAELRKCLTQLGFRNVSTYIASGNVLLQSDKPASQVAKIIQEMLPQNFKLDTKQAKVLVLTQDQLAHTITNKPSGFGEQPNKFHSDAIFLIDVSEDEAMAVFRPREGVDTVWKGNGVIYSQRLSAERTKSRLNKIVGTVPYQSMTIRSWNTTQKLLALITEMSLAPSDDFPKEIGKVAARELGVNGINNLKDIVNYSEAELLAIHGVGPKAVKIIKEVLQKQGASLKG